MSRQVYSADDSEAVAELAGGNVSAGDRSKKRGSCAAQRRLPSDNRAGCLGGVEIPSGANQLDPRARDQESRRVEHGTAWILLLKPVLGVELWVYSMRLGPVVRALQIAGLLAIAAAVPGIWCLWRISGLQASRFAWIRNAALAAALLDIVWSGFAGKLFSFNLNY